MKILLTLILGSIVLSSCSKQSPQKISVNVDTLATVYSELLVLNERYSLSKDSLTPQQYESEYKEVLSSHHYTKERFALELETVARSSDDFRRLCDRAMTNFQLMRRKVITESQRGRS